MTREQFIMAFRDVFDEMAEGTVTLATLSGVSVAEEQFDFDLEVTGKCMMNAGPHQGESRGFSVYVNLSLMSLHSLRQVVKSVVVAVTRAFAMLQVER
jgi:hypothetical protein